MLLGHANRLLALPAHLFLMIPMIRTILTLLCVAAIAGADDKKPIDFAHDIVPIINKHCAECHTKDKAEGGFSLNSKGLILDAEAVVVGKADVSRLIELIESSDPKDQMPPKAKPRLSAREIALMKRWVNEGLKWENGFSFAVNRYKPPLLPRRPDLPKAMVEGVTNPVDLFVHKYFAEYDVKIPERLSDGAFRRKLYLDVVGILPAAEADFHAETTKTTNRDQLIDHVLSLDRLYAEHWLTFWNDALRNAYSGTGYIDGGRSQITAWLYESLLTNKRYDQFVRELISPTDQSRGFIAGIKWRGNVNASQQREVQFAQSISQTLLGVNMKCASCHDSFVDHWKLENAYGLAAVYSTRELEIHRCDKPTGRKAKAAWLFPELGEIDANAPQPERLNQLASLMTHPKNGRFTRTIVNRIWNQLMGRGIVHPVDAMHTEPWSEDLLDYLAMYLVEHDYDMKAVIKLIVSSQTYQSRAVVFKETPEGKYIFRGPVVKRLTAEQFLDAVRAVTDNWNRAPGNVGKYAPSKQGGQFAAVLLAHQDQKQWGDRPARAVFIDNDMLQRGLGRPNREQIVTSRPDHITTLEALYLSNGPEFAKLIGQGAAKLLNRKEDAEALIQTVYAEALSRRPTPQEAAIATEILGDSPTQASVEDFLWTVFLLPEFQFNS